MNIKRTFLPALLCLLIIVPSALFSQSGNLRLPKFRFTGGEYDTLAYKIAQERLEETAGLLERKVIPSEYVVGPNDQLVLSIFTSTPQTYNLIVSPDGKIVIPTVGVVYVDGITLDKVEDQIRQKVSSVWKGVESAVALSKVRKFKVFVGGAVRKASYVEASPVDRISEVIERTGGIRYEGSLRSVTLRRTLGKQEIVKNVDILRFITWGDIENNPTVSDGDRIIVNYSQKSYMVGVYGAVGDTLTAEYREGDSASTLIRLAGGFQPGALLDSVEVVRFDAGAAKGVRRLILDMSSWKDRLYSAAPLPNDVPLYSGDRIFVRSSSEKQRYRRVVVLGEVKYPGNYFVDEGETLSQLLNRVGGVTEDASLEGAVFVRQQGIDIVDREFQRLSKLTTQEMTESELRYFKARAREFPGLLSIDFQRLVNEGSQADDVTLFPEDSIYIPLKKNYVTVLGKVTSPGRVIYRDSLSYLDYIRLAGGLAYRSDEDETLIVKSKGEQFLADNFNYKIEPGDNILVPEQSDTKFIDVFTDALTITAQLFTVAAVIFSIVRPR